MTNSAPRFSASPEKDVDGSSGLPHAVSAIDEQAFVAAAERLSAALDRAAQGRCHDDIAVARMRLRELAVKLRDAGYWRSDKQGLRATVSLLWQADRYVSEMSLNGKATKPGTD